MNIHLLRVLANINVQLQFFPQQRMIMQTVAQRCNLRAWLTYNPGQNTWDKSQNCTTSVFDYVTPAPPVSMLIESNTIWLSQHGSRGKRDEKVLNVCFHLDILTNMTKTQKFASVPIYFDQDCSYSRTPSGCKLIKKFAQFPNRKRCMHRKNQSSKQAQNHSKNPHSWRLWRYLCWLVDSLAAET